MKKMILLSAVLLSACSTDDPNRRAKTGAVIGAVAGGVLGHQISHKNGAVIGAVAGGLAGAGIGHYMDKQQQELEAQLAQERANQSIEVQRVNDELLKVTLASEVSFDFNSAEIKYNFQSSLDKLAAILNKYHQTRVRIVGHTDSVGSAEYNQQLSLRRAQAVADYLVQKGLDSARIQVEGKGESEPRASNQTAAGRQLNRRVELFLQPLESHLPASKTPPQYR